MLVVALLPALRNPVHQTSETAKDRRKRELVHAFTDKSKNIDGLDHVVPTCGFEAHLKFRVISSKHCQFVGLTSLWQCQYHSWLKLISIWLDIWFTGLLCKVEAGRLLGAWRHCRWCHLTSEVDRTISNPRFSLGSFRAPHYTNIGVRSCILAFEKLAFKADMKQTWGEFFTILNDGR